MLFSESDMVTVTLAVLAFFGTASAAALVYLSARDKLKFDLAMATLKHKLEVAEKERDELRKEIKELKNAK